MTFLIERSALLMSVVLCAASCGAKADDDKTSTSAAEQPVFFAATDGNALVVASVRADTKAVATFGGAIPGVTATSHSIFSISASTDRSRVVVVVEPVANDKGDKVGTSFLVGSDGTSWHVIEQSDNALLAEESSDLSLLWITRSCTPNRFDGLSRQELVAWNGSHVVDTGDCAAPPTRNLVLGDFSTDGQHVFMIENGTDLIDLGPDGSGSKLLKRYPPPTTNTPANPSANPTSKDSGASVRQVFATSILMEDGAALDWLDFDGKPIDVPGLSGDTSLSAGYFIDQNSSLFVISDRKVESLQKVPVNTQPQEIEAAVPGKYVVFAGRTDTGDETIETIKVDGSVANSYAPEGPGTPSIAVVHMSSKTAKKQWAVAPVSFYGANEGDYIPMLAYGEDLLLFGDDASITKIELRRVNGSPTLLQPGASRIYQPSSSGTYLIYADSVGFHRRNIATNEDIALDSTLKATLSSQLTSWTDPSFN